MDRERRQHPRYRVDWQGRMMLPSKQIVEIKIDSASRGGVRIIFDHAVPVGTPVNIEFFVFYRNKDTRIRAKTQVAYNDILAGNRGARIGLQFQEISSDSMHALANALHAAGEENLQ